MGIAQRPGNRTETDTFRNSRSTADTMKYMLLMMRCIKDQIFTHNFISIIKLQLLIVLIIEKNYTQISSTLLAIRTAIHNARDRSQSTKGQNKKDTAIFHAPISLSVTHNTGLKKARLHPVTHECLTHQARSGVPQDQIDKRRQ